jgi:hypothetical protein
MSGVGGRPRWEVDDAQGSGVPERVVLVVLALAVLAGPAGAATAIEYGLIAG